MVISLEGTGLWGNRVTKTDGRSSRYFYERILESESLDIDDGGANVLLRLVANIALVMK